MKGSTSSSLTKKQTRPGGRRTGRRGSSSAQDTTTPEHSASSGQSSPSPSPSSEPTSPPPPKVGSEQHQEATPKRGKRKRTSRKTTRAKPARRGRGKLAAEEVDDLNQDDIVEEENETGQDSRLHTRAMDEAEAEEDRADPRFGKMDEDDSSGGEPGEAEDDAKGEETATGNKRKRKKSKKKLERERTLPIIVQWLRDTYEEKEGKTVGRYQVYDDYLEYCAKTGHLPTNNAALGKIFKRVFPNVGWRRLGKRGESKMHYANIRHRKVKPESLQALSVPQRDDLPAGVAGLDASGPPQPSSAAAWMPTGGGGGSGGVKVEASASDYDFGYGDALMPTLKIGVALDDDDGGDGDDKDYIVGEEGLDEDYMHILQIMDEEGSEAGQQQQLQRYDHVVGGAGGAFGGGAVPMAQHRTRMPGRERERRLWRRRDHLTTSREEMEEPRGLFVGSSSSWSSSSSSPSSYSSLSSSQTATSLSTSTTNTTAGPPSQGRLAIWNANAHLDLMMAVRYYRDRFRKISWSLIPINPLSLKMRLLNYLFATEDGQLERSSLSLSACVMISIASFGVGHFDVAEEFFHKAREHLSYVFDSSDYDVASALVPLAWLTTFFSPTQDQGRRRQIYFCTIGTKICEQVGALNDGTYWALLSTLHVKSMENVTQAIARTRAYPPYQKQWKITHLQRGKISRTYDQTGEIFGSVFSLSVPLLQGTTTSPEQDRQIKQEIMVQLGRVREAELSLVHAQDQQVRDMMAAYYFAMRTFINVLLENARQIECARELVRTLLLADRPIMAVVMHELSANNFLLIRTAIQVLTRYHEFKAMKLLMEAIYPFTSRFIWMHQIYVLMQQMVEQSLQSMRQNGGQRAMTCSPPLPLRPALEPSGALQAFTGTPPLLSASTVAPVPHGPNVYQHHQQQQQLPPQHLTHPQLQQQQQQMPPHHNYAQPSQPHEFAPPSSFTASRPPLVHQFPGHHTSVPSSLPVQPDRRPSSASYSFIFYADPTVSRQAAPSPYPGQSFVGPSPTALSGAEAAASGDYHGSSHAPQQQGGEASVFRSVAATEPDVQDFELAEASPTRALEDMSLLESLLSSSPTSSSFSSSAPPDPGAFAPPPYPH